MDEDGRTIAPWHLPSNVKENLNANPALREIQIEKSKPIVKPVETNEENFELRCLKDAGAKLLKPPLNGILIKGWRIETKKKPILNASQISKFENELGTSHLPEMVFGESSLTLIHELSGILIKFDAFDALKFWMDEKLPPVQIPAAVKWKSRRKQNAEIIFDYDYTFTTPYCGTTSVCTIPKHNNEENEEIEEGVEKIQIIETESQNSKFESQNLKTEVQNSKTESQNSKTESQSLKTQVPNLGIESQNLVGMNSNFWKETNDEIDISILQKRDPILFYDEVILYEDELADSGISLLTVKVRVMQNYWFVLLRFWLRVDGSLMRIRDCRYFCPLFSPNLEKKFPCVVRERCFREQTFHSLASKGYPSESTAYPDADSASHRLQIVFRTIESLSCE